MSGTPFPHELPDPRDPNLEQFGLIAARKFTTANRMNRERCGEGDSWMDVDAVCFTLAALYNAWLEMKAKAGSTPRWDQARAEMSRCARLAYDTLILTVFEPSGSTPAGPAFGIGYGYGLRHLPPSREDVQAYVLEALEWWWLLRLRALADTRLPKGYAPVLDRVPVFRHATSTPPVSLPVSPDLAPQGSPPSSVAWHGDSTLPLDESYAHKSMHAVIGWRANGMLGVLALHVERSRWVWYSDFRQSDLTRKVLGEAGLSPLLNQPSLPGSLRGHRQQ
ncbi:hypothetical protein CC85DRAFT_286800 [Cutaneotrichosporon oleaginosum]|uniref:Uncharacterized protein n=1 Tax=Cutaneotrichosporon oleaginosum TaxID=879819 RepID=A0A0J0XJ32_9TREE|nr:uncharacterized protein CC85DRAFT_286800 [Cutaneotrichosporon oleaginosum]KLT41110.1 hypothetical protein CC85DRAFT_286800 [Cutaneotrichosporon oleaginosum]TXT05758.1 hypothetical protein COLE_07078 [Cutaneotrichosporon oleaginosum]